MLSKRGYRILFVVLLLFSSGFLMNSYISYATAEVSPTGLEAPPRDNITVITQQGDANAPRFKGQIVAFNPDGTVLYRNASLDNYEDVDPSPLGSETVFYVGSNQRVTTRVCGPRGERCSRQIIERVNLSTGTVTRVYSRITRRSQTWHDVDRIDESRVVVAATRNDRVFILNTTTGIIEWDWSAQNHYPMSSGGTFPYDWTHLNDVEYLDDGRIMVSIRNQDQVIFIDRNRGVVDEWTLGTDDEHRILYEQHNPDYIPREDGGPAIVVADSENNRAVEYQRTENGWNRTWQWTDARMQWPRDVDRLPNGHTLITDTNGGRVFEIDRSGDIVWQVDVSGPYDAERLGTGAESANGPSATQADLRSRIGPESQSADEEGGDSSVSLRKLLIRFWIAVKSVIPPRLLNALLFVRPRWASNVDLLMIAVFGTVSLSWGAVELRWSKFGFRSPVTRGEG